MTTIKQKLAFNKVVNGSTITKAMREVGYADSTASRTNKLTKTKGWSELTEHYLPDKLITKRHNEQLNSSKLTKLYFDVDDEDEMIEKVCKELGVELLFIKVNKDKTGKTVNVKAPDLFFRDLAIDKAYKLKGKYSAENNSQINVNIIQGVEINVRKNDNS